MKIRIKFSKQGHMRFIGHLDLQRFFQKAMRRANIPIRFTEGMSPHMVMSFASPLGVGLTSDAEYIDIETTEAVSTKEALARLNALMPEGLRVLDWRQLPDEKKTSAMSLVKAADYEISFREGYEPESDAWLSRVEDFLAQPQILVEKENKKALKKAARRQERRGRAVEEKPPVPETVSADIRPMIFSMEADSNARRIRAFLSSGSAANLKPEALMDAYLEFCGISPKPFSYAVNRLELYAEREGQEGFISLNDLGSMI